MLHGINNFAKPTIANTITKNFTQQTKKLWKNSKFYNLKLNQQIIHHQAKKQ